MDDTVLQVVAADVAGWFLQEAVDRCPNRKTGGCYSKEYCKNYHWTQKGQRHPLTSRTMEDSAINREMDRTPGQCTARAAAETNRNLSNQIDICQTSPKRIATIQELCVLN